MFVYYIYFGWGVYSMEIGFINMVSLTLVMYGMVEHAEEMLIPALG